MRFRDFRVDLVHCPFALALCESFRPAALEYFPEMLSIQLARFWRGGWRTFADYERYRASTYDLSEKDGNGTCHVETEFVKNLVTFSLKRVIYAKCSCQVCLLEVY